MVGFSRNEELLFASGIYNDWVDKATGEVISSFTILTTKTYDFIDKMGHDRSPLFTKEKAYQEWLSMGK